MKKILIIITALFLTVSFNLKAGFTQIDNQTDSWLLRSSTEEGDDLIGEDEDPDGEVKYGTPISDALPFLLILACVYGLRERRKERKFV